MSGENSQADVNTFLDLARKSQSLGRWEETAYYCRKALQAQPGSEDAIFILARAVRKLGMYELAGQLLMSVMHTARRKPRLFHVRALLQFAAVRWRQGKRGEALFIFYRIIRAAAKKGLHMLGLRKSQY